MGLPFNNNERQRTIQGAPRKNYSFLSTGSPKYWLTDDNKIPDLLDFFITNGISTTYVDIQANYDLTSDHTPIIATISKSVAVRQPPPRLHNSQTNWETYRKLVRDKANLAIKLNVKMLSSQLTTSSVYYNTPLKKPLQPGTPNEQPTTYPVKLRDSWLQSAKPGPPGKEPIHQIADEYLTKQAINLNLHSMKCGTHPLLPTFLTLKEMIILLGNQ